MKPDWDKLVDEFKDSKTALVADVDCTAGGKSLCEKHGVSGYPTIKWGEPSDLKKYEGDRSFQALQTFAQQNLGPVCGPNNLELCDDSEKKLVQKYLKWDIDELDMSIEEGDAKIKTLDEKGKKVTDKIEGDIKKMREKIEKEEKKKESQVAKAKKEAGYKYMKAVQGSKKPAAEEGKEES